MNRVQPLLLACALFVPAVSLAQATDNHTGMTDADMQKKCMEMTGKHGDMKGTDMKGMHAQCMEHKANNHAKPQSKAAPAKAHKAVAVVKGVDSANGKVTLAHEPVKTLNWPAMTMSFMVKDKALFDKLPVGKKVNVEFVQEGSDYVVSSVN